MPYIYKTTNNINSKIYIGKTCRRRKKYLGSGKILKLAIKKYGFDNFTKEIIEYCKDRSELDEREKYWIAYYNSTDKNIGYNITLGGEGGDTFSYYFLGKKFTTEHRRNIALNHHNVKGKNNPMFGRSHSKEVKLRISALNKGTKASEAAKRKMSQQRRGEKNHKAKLTEKEVNLIRSEYTGKIKLEEIAKNHNVKKACIWKIIHRHTWKHI